MVKRIGGLVVFFLFMNMSMAFSKPGNVNGKVKDNKGKVIPVANVVLLDSAGKTLVQAVLSDDDGNFELEAVPDGSYIIKVSQIGYETYTSQQIDVVNAVMVMPEIVMTEKSNTLKEVSVRAQKPLIEVHADKLVVNVENSIVNAGSSALEILARSPGVRVDQNDNISLKGRQGVNVMIDGKITPVAGDDLANILKSMPANTIDKIEIISNPGARYDAAGTGGIINIRTKKDQKVGFNGSVNGSYAQGIYPKANAGANITYRDNKVSLYANYNYAYRYWFNHLFLNRHFYNDAGIEQASYVQDNYSLFDFRNHTGSIGVDYTLSQKTTVGLSVNLGTNKFDPKADNRSRELDGNKNISYFFNTNGRHHNSYYNYALNASLRHQFDSAGKELSIDADYAAYGNQSDQNFTTNFLTIDGDEYQPSYYMTSDLTGFTQIRSGKADYTQPLKGNAKFEAGGKVSFVKADNEPLFYELINGEQALDATRSNHFIYNENINAGYVNLSKDWTKWSTQLGVRVENTNVTAEQVTLKTSFDRNYTQLFPSIAVQRHVNKENDLGLTLSRRIERPNYQQLNPFKFFIDKTTYREGYPYLLPGTSYSAELSHTFRQRFITTLTYSYVDNPITEVIQPSENDTGRVTVQTNKNLDRQFFYCLSGAYNFQVTKWWTNVTNLNIYYTRYYGNVANTQLDRGAPTFDINTNNSFLLPNDLSAEVGLFYQARMVYGFMELGRVWMLNLGLQKHFFDKKATLRLNVQDLFWKGYPTAVSLYSNYREDFIAQRDTRQITVSLTYRFGKRTVAPARRRDGGAEEEKRRAGTGNG